MTAGFSQHILYTQEQIKMRIAELGKTISKDFAGSSLLILGVLKGSTIFLADLVRQISLEVEIDFLRVSSNENFSIKNAVSFSIHNYFMKLMALGV